MKFQILRLYQIILVIVCLVFQASHMLTRLSNNIKLNGTRHTLFENKLFKRDDKKILLIYNIKY